MTTRLSPTQVRVLRELARGNRLSAQLERRTGRWQLRVYLRWTKPPEQAPATVRRSTLWVLINAGYIRPIHEGTHLQPGQRFQITPASCSRTPAGRRRLAGQQ